MVSIQKSLGFDYTEFTEGRLFCVLDVHGMSLDSSYRYVRGSIEYLYSQNLRNVKVITGHGEVYNKLEEWLEDMFDSFISMDRKNGWYEITLRKQEHLRASSLRKGSNCGKRL